MIKIVFLSGIALMSIQLVQPFATGLPISYLLFLISLSLVIFDGIASKKLFHKWMPLHPLWIPATLILGSGILSLANSLEPILDIVFFLKAWFSLTFWVSLVIVMTQKNMIQAIITTFVLTVMITSSIAILDFMLDTEIGLLFVSPSVDRSFFLSYNSEGRYRGTTYHVNGQTYFTLIAACLVLNSIFIKLKEQIFSKKKVFFLFIIWIISIYANILTGSVSSYIGLILSLAVLTVIHIVRALNKISPQPIIRIFVFIWILSLSFVFFLLFSDFSLFFHSSITRVFINTGPGRYQALQDSLSYIIKSPFLGTGGVGYIEKYQVFEDSIVHNPLFLLFVLGGGGAFLGMSLIYLITLKYIFQAIVSYISNKEVHPHLIGICTSIIGCFVMDMAQTHVFGLEKWLVVGLLFGLAKKKRIVSNQDQIMYRFRYLKNNKKTILNF